MTDYPYQANQIGTGTLNTPEQRTSNDVVAELERDIPLAYEEGVGAYAETMRDAKKEIERLRAGLEAMAKSQTIDGRTLDHYCGNEFAEYAEEILAGTAVETNGAREFQARVAEWMEDCFTRPDALTVAQRSFRFVEEALELAQAAGTSALDVMRLVAYVYDRPTGTRHQEIGGVMLTLAGLARACGEDMSHCAEEELQRCIANTEKIRAKDLAKPERSPLPGSPEKASE